MRSAFDFSTWQGALATLLGLALVSVIAIGIRLLLMHTVQQRRERENRQINERLKTLIAAYKTLGGSFTGELAVDPSHLREQRQAPADAAASDPSSPGAERRRRVRDAVEAALSDVLLLGTADQVRLAVQAANDMVAGRPVETAALVISLRSFIRDVLDLEPVPSEFGIPKQGPLRPATGGARGGRNERGGGAGGGAGGGRGGGGRGAGGAGLGMGVGLGAGAAHDAADADAGTAR